MIPEITIGHNVLADYELADFIMPKNLEDNYWILTTIWNDNQKTGQTLKIFVSSKSYWDLMENPPILLGKHKTKEKALRFHEKALKEIREDGRYV